MKKIANGFQCEVCRIIYADQEKALECENQKSDTLSFQIGQKIKDSHGEKDYTLEIRSIHFEGHEIVYVLETQLKDGRWVRMYKIRGNQDMISYFGKSIIG